MQSGSGNPLRTDDTSSTALLDHLNHRVLATIMMPSALSERIRLQHSAPTGAIHPMKAKGSRTEKTNPLSCVSKEVSFKTVLEQSPNAPSTLNIRNTQGFWSKLQRLKHSHQLSRCVGVLSKHARLIGEMVIGARRQN